jgi:hypothetical protein
MRDTVAMDQIIAAPADRPEHPAPDRDFEPSLAAVRAAPVDGGELVRIVLRPEVELRLEVDTAVLDPVEGVIGDSWKARGSSRTPDGAASQDAQVTIMSTRVLAAIEPDPARWILAGDQLLVEADLSVANLPPGTRLAIGEAVVEVSEAPHTGCAKFSARFGSDALRWVNSPLGRELRMRGVNVRVVQGGVVRIGDRLRKA